MRPTRLELAGFTCFRDPATVDFAAADLFVLTGPTGSGKSSVIDAMCFALYGAIPRYDDKRLVAPVISQGKLEARVRLDFEVDGADYTAVRVVRRTRTGATTREARLERRVDGEVLAGDADALTRKIERLLGLSFAEFKTCVVLPQGDFARLLHATAKERQDLLVRLLDLGVFRRMQQAANQRGLAASSAAELVAQQLERLVAATPEAEASARERVAVLQALRARIEQTQPELDRLSAMAEAARRQAAETAGWADQLAQVEVPAGVEALAAARATATGQRGAADAAASLADAAVEAAEDTRRRLPDAALLTLARARHAERAQEAARMETAARAVEEAAGDVKRAALSLDAAQQQLHDAEAAVAAIERAHAAHHLASRLRAGDACPVCRRPVQRVPTQPQPAELDPARRRQAHARRRLDEAGRALDAARDREIRCQAEREAIAQRMAELDNVLVDQPQPQEIERLLQAISDADAQLAQARTRVKQARARQLLAVSELEQADRRERTAWAELDAVRDRLASLQPPPVDRDDLPGTWRALTSWARGAEPVQRRAAQESERQARAAETRRRELHESLVAACADADVAVGDRPPRDACVDALSAAQAELGRIRQAIAEAARLAAERDRLREAARVAQSLGRHLGSGGFEKWLLDEALARLVAAASSLLEELSAGQYALVVDPSHGFEVVDHRNADERRLAKTLSGGETFLASLSLALALAGQVAELATHGAARLESTFLDEGFGSLDADTLDVVATTLEELGARGRMVGLVTHVRDLADRLPVRFEVRKGPATSSIERWDGQLLR